MKKIKPIICLMTVLIGLQVATSSLSMAWFVNSSFLRIEYIDISFHGGDNLLISTSKNNESSYKDSLTSEDLKETGLFIPVSAMKSSDWMSTKSSDPIFYGDHDRNSSTIEEVEDVKYVVPTETIATEGYFSQELFLKSDTDHYAYLDTDSLASYLVADEEANKQRAETMLSGDASLGTVEELTERMNYLQKSMRFSILVDSEYRYDYKIYDPYKEGDTYFGGTIDTEYNGTFDVKYDVSSSKNYEILYGEVENREKIVYSYNEFIDKKISPTWCDSGHKENTYVIDKEASLNNGVTIAKENSITLEENNEAKNKLMNGNASMVDKLLLIPLEANIPTRIVVSIYMEGWDIDNIDAAMGGSFKANLTFGLLDRNII